MFINENPDFEMIGEILSNGVYDLFLKVCDDKIEITLNDTVAFLQTLVISEISEKPSGEICEDFFYNDVKLIKEEDTYVLTSHFYDVETGTHSFSDIKFKKMQVHSEVFNAVKGIFFNFSPACVMRTLKYALEEKEKHLPELLNKKEKEILPLLKELSEEEIEKYNKAKNEGKWREIFTLIKNSQEEYPVKADLCANIGEIRQKITQCMKSHGYEGGYPDFYKTAPIEKMRLAKAYNFSYLVVREKQARHYIHCCEDFFDSGESNIY